MKVFLVLCLCGISLCFGDLPTLEISLGDTERASLESESPQTLAKIDQKEPLTVNDIKKMTKAGLSEQTIISQIEATGSVFYLSTADIIDLKGAGVSQGVIDYMIKTGNQ